MIRFDFPLWILIPYLFAIGAVIGSFLNVCIHRLPKSEDLLDQLRGLWSPPSHCPRCRSRILLRDNVPVIGWLRLGGRCRTCKKRISPRYPLIEAANGLLFVIVFLAEVPTGSSATIQDSCIYFRLGPLGDPYSLLFSPLMVCLWRWIVHMVLIECLVVATFIDFDLRIIPDGATVPAIVTGVLAGWGLGCVYIAPVWFQDVSTMEALSYLSNGWFGAVLRGPEVPGWITAHPHWHGLAVSLAGLVVGGGSIWMVRIIGHFVLKREAMGFGDVVLMAAIGSVLGWQPTLLVFFLAPLAALVIVAVCWIFRRDREIPYGPYLSLGALIVILGWKVIWPPAERIFSLGAFVPVMGVFMCALLYVTLQMTQWLKRLLGIPDFEEEEANWQAADQLFHFGGENVDGRGNWRRRAWPGIDSGRGAVHEQAWRRGGNHR